MARPSSEIRRKQYQSVIESGLLAFLAVWIFRTGILAGWRVLNTDFPNYYVAARLIREHYSLDRIYDWIWFQRAADHFGIEHQLVGFLGLTPFSFFPIITLAGLPALEAKRLWIVCSLGLLIGTVHLLGRATGLTMRSAWIITLLSGIALRNNFALGQMHILVLALLATGYVCHMRGRQVLCGACIAIAAALKIYPIFFCLYFIVKGRWRSLIAIATCTALCFWLSCQIAGWETTKTYLLEQLPRTFQGEAENPFLPGATSATALFHRLFLFEPEFSTHPLVNSPLLYSILYPLWQATLAALILIRVRAGFHADDRETLEWCSFLTLLMFLSSAPSTYHFVVLVSAAIPTLGVLFHLQKRKEAAIFLVLYASACNLGTLQTGKDYVGILTILLYVKLWIGVAILIIYAVALRTQPSQHSSGLLLRRPAVKFAIILGGLWLPGFLGAKSHLKGIHSDYVRRLAFVDDAYLRTQPQSTDNGLLYVAMLQSGYHVMRNGSPLIANFKRWDASSDELSFSTDSSGKQIWIEVAASGQSRLERVVSNAPGPEECEIADAQYPSLTPDGSWLAFLREDRGRGSLWLFHTSDCGRNNRQSDFVRITPTSWDVRTIGSGGANSFLISASYQGKDRIFKVFPNGSAPVLVPDEVGDASPAASPDGSRIAVRRLVNERWQIGLLDLSSKGRKTVTSGDCNAYTPSWKDNNTLLYATDCGRGMGQTAIATARVKP